MNFYDCAYVDIIPFRNGNEYNETYGCSATGMNCDCCQCKLTEEEAKRLFDERMKENVGNVRK